jgi:tetratricopeptide (TPR) repeat protein
LKPEPGSATEPGQRHVFRAFSRLLSTLSQRAPLVLLIDEMQWIDETSAALLEYVWPLVRQQPVLFLLLFEPAEERRCWDLRRQAANLYADVYREVFLHPLSEAEAGQLLGRRPGSAALSPQTRRALLQVTGGNPLFLIEALRWRQQAGEEDSWPITLLNLLIVRIAFLGPEARRLLQIAAVIGLTFPRHILAHALMLDGRGEDALQHLQQLQASEMVEPLAFPDAFHAYAFTHGLVCQAAYESLTEPERACLHLVVAQAIEETAGDQVATYYASLAHHYAHAAQPDQALRYVRLAGDQSLWRHANAEAMAYYQAGLRLATGRPDLYGERPGLLRQIAILHARRGEWLECVRVYERVLATQADNPLGQAETYWAIAQVQRSLGDRDAEGYYVQKALAVLPALRADGPADAAASLRAALLLSQSSLAWARGDQSAALAAAQPALDLAQKAQDGNLAVLAWNQIGAAYLLSGDDTLVRETFFQALAACEAPDVGLEARARTYLNAGDVQAEIIGDRAAAQDLFERTLALAQDLGSDTWAAWAHFSLAKLAFERGDWDQAEDQLRRGEDLCEGRNLAEATLYSLLFRGRLLLARGQPQAAYEHYRRAAETAETLGDVVQGFIPARLGQGLALWALGRPDPAALLLEQTLHLSQQEGTSDNIAAAYFPLVRLLLARGDVVAARRVVDSVAPALALSQRPWVQAQNHWLHGLLAAAEARPEDAEHDLRAGQRAWQRRGCRYEEGQVLLDLARFYHAQGREAEAIQCRDEAIALFRLLGAAGDQAQAEALELAE